MDFGILPNWSWPLDGSPRQQSEKTLEQIRSAVDNEYDAIWFGQHYISEGNNQFQPLPLMARAASFSGSLDMGTSIFLLPIHNPIAVAENFATVDSLFDGDLLFGVAIGYKPEEFDSFGVEKKHRVGRLVEAVELLRLLWTEDNVSYDGTHFSVDDITIDPKPNDGDGVSIWLGGNAETSVRRAGELGDGWIISARTTLEDAKELSAIYEDAAANSPYPDEGIGLNREVFVAPTTEEAEDTVRPLMKDRAQKWLDRGATDTADQIDDLDAQIDEMLEDRFVGSPEECVERISRFEAEVGVDHLIAMYNWRELPQSEVLDSIRLFQEEVAPHFS